MIRINKGELKNDFTIDYFSHFVRILHLDFNAKFLPKPLLLFALLFLFIFFNL